MGGCRCAQRGNQRWDTYRCQLRQQTALPPGAAQQWRQTQSDCWSSRRTKLKPLVHLPAIQTTKHKSSYRWNSAAGAGRGGGHDCAAHSAASEEAAARTPFGTGSSSREWRWCTDSHQGMMPCRCTSTPAAKAGKQANRCIIPPAAKNIQRLAPRGPNRAGSPKRQLTFQATPVTPSRLLPTAPTLPAV